MPNTLQAIVHFNAYLAEQIAAETTDPVQFWSNYMNCDILKVVDLKRQNIIYIMHIRILLLFFSIKFRKVSYEF